MSDRPVVLVVIKGLGIGGAERLVAEAAPYWDRPAFDYRVAYLLSWKDQLVGELEAKDVAVRLVGVGRGLGPRSLWRLRRHIIDSGATLVHAHLPAAGILARLVSPVPVIYTEHNVVDYYRRPTRIMNRLTYGRNARVVAVSTAVAESVASYPGPRPVVINNGVSVAVTQAERDEAREELRLAPGQRLIVHVGNIRPHKGHRNLVQAVQKLAGERSDFVVVSVGGEKHPGDLNRLQTEVAALGLADRIRFLGRRPDALAFLAAADVVVNPSDVEGLPLVVLEAMALGRPVVATAVGGVPDLIATGHTGVLVEPHAPEALAKEVADLLDNPVRAGEIGRRAGRAITASHGLERMVRSVEDLYSEVLGR